MVILFDGILLIFLGLISIFLATKLKPNYLIGYRSIRANKSQESFLEANRYAGKFMIAEGLLSIGLSFFIGHVPREYTNFLGVGNFILLVLIMFLFTEIRLKRMFG